MYIIENDGKRRKAKQNVCQQCGTIFLGRIKATRKYCSVLCKNNARSIKLQKPNIRCGNCDKWFYKNKSKLKASKSGFHFCCRICKDTAQKLGGIKEIMPPHYGTNNSYRKQFADEDFVCKRCGYNEFKSGVQIHHIDRDRTNNEKENLIPLCACCHMTLHYGCWGTNRNKYEQLLDGSRTSLQN